MKQARTNTSGWRAPAAAAVFAAALGLAVFYHGPQLILLAGAQLLLVAWLAFSIGASYAQGIRVPINPLSATVALYWIWLALSLWWTPVPVTSVINFWWIGSFALAFWCYVVSVDRERVWFYLARLALAGGFALAAFAMVQLLLWHQPPRSTFINIHSFAALLMLIALPLSSHFLRYLHDKSRRSVVIGVGACLFFLFFTIACTEGRGTTLSLILSMAVLVWLAWRSVGSRPCMALVGIGIGAYLAATLLLHGELSGSRLTTLSDPASAGIPRFLIWRGSWEMLMTNPWWGNGLGTYYLAWPPYRDPADTSLGFFVHNDYLQIWIEGGLPALLLLLGIFVATLVLFVRFLRRRQLPVALRLEAIGLFCGLGAIAMHSFVDFNLYILPTTLLAGVALGRFHECVVGALPYGDRILRPARHVRPRLYRTMVVMFALFPLSYFIALGAADQLYKRGFDLANRGQLQESDRAFTWAERLLANDDKTLMMHADLYRNVLSHVPRRATTERRSLYQAALAMLDEAESANPYRPLVGVIRARLLQDNPDLSGPSWQTEVEKNYVRALALDPRYLTTRVAYARLLLESGRQIEAYGVLEGGMNYWYYPGLAVLTYYDFTMQLAERLGQTARAADLGRRIEVLRDDIEATVAPRPPAPELNLPVATSAS